MTNLLILCWDAAKNDNWGLNFKGQTQNGSTTRVMALESPVIIGFTLDLQCESWSWKRGLWAFEHFGCSWTSKMTERQLRTDYFSNSHLLHLIFQAPGASPNNLSWPWILRARLGLALPVDSLSLFGQSLTERVFQALILNISVVVWQWAFEAHELVPHGHIHRDLTTLMEWSN